MKKYALVTGASSGIGKEIALELNRRGFNIIICARRVNRLEELSHALSGDTRAIACDLSRREECFRLYESVRSLNVCVLVNNAGFGVIGDFDKTNLDRELEMLDVNCAAVHILTKLFVRDFKAKNRGYILNVASSAGLMPGGPLMAAYYATKSYVVSLTSSVNEELRRSGSRVWLSALCPGPVDTEFNNVAGCEFGVESISARECAKCAVDGLFSRRLIIVPTTYMKLGSVLSRLMPKRLVLFVTGHIQSKKIH